MSSFARQGQSVDSVSSFLQAVEKLAKSFKARMTVRLAVAGAFHTAYMKPAEERLR